VCTLSDRLAADPISSLFIRFFTAFGALTLLAGHLEEHPVCKKLSEEVLVCVVIRLERGADCLRNGPADATAIPKPHNLLPRLNPDWF